nr:BspA family leucine-rich repeat surface protein [Mycoplasmopsis bovis]
MNENVSNVTNMERMFQEAKSFNGRIDNWNVESVTELDETFLQCKWIFNKTYQIEKLKRM